MSARWRLITNRSWRTWLLLILLTVLGLGLWAYTTAAEDVQRAREARRIDNYPAAEAALSACWPLPGLQAAIELEEQLLAVQQGDLHAEDAWQQQVALAGPHAQLILEALAKGNLAAFKWAQAEHYAQSLLVKSPQDPRALGLRGRARLNMQREDEALEDFQRAVEIAPQAADLRRGLADVLYQLGHVRTAIGHYIQLGREQALDDQGVSNLARCLQDEAQLDQAQTLLDRWLELYPQSIDTLIERARLALRLGQPATAEDFARRATALHPDHADANFVLELAAQAQHKHDPQLEQRVEENAQRQAKLKLSLHESRHTPELLTAVGQWMVRVGTAQEAPAWFYSALQQDPEYQPAHRELAEFFRQAGQPRRADQHARHAGNRPADDSSGPASSAAPNRGNATTSRLPLEWPSLLNMEHDVPEADAAAVDRLCSACHPFPGPESMPRNTWREEVKQAYDFLRNSHLSGDFPALESVVKYYEARAPEKFAVLASTAANQAPPVRFEKRGTGWLPNQPPLPAIANARLASLSDGTRQDLILCDSRLDAVLVLKPYQTGPGGKVLQQLTAPCHATVCDLDGDRQQDMVVASLGNFFPTDDRVGKVLWLQGKSDGQFELHTLLEGVGRVADVQVADFNADGRSDLIVAVFGWRNTGEILYLENITTHGSPPQFSPTVLDARHGAIHLPIADLNLDGRPDFLALISQEHEQVVAFINQGDGVFAASTLFTAPHPSYGCSGIQAVDMDGDGDLDVLLTNGDVMDRPYILKPYHGVQWLENRGTFPFVHHSIGGMYGAAQAVAADFDADGDHDVVAVSMLPKMLFPDRETRNLPSVVLFEQRADGQFKTHVLEVGSCDHFSCAAGDWDGDGRVDLAVANFAWDGSQPLRDAATLWYNAGK